MGAAATVNNLATMFAPYSKASRRIARFSAVAFCLAAIGCSHSETYHGVEIHGSEKFAGQVREALELIRNNSPEDFVSISESVRRIEESDRSGMDTSRSVCQLAPATAYHSLTWCAGCIAHESHHAKLSQSASYSYGYAHEEQVCIEYQRTVLERIGAPTCELDYLSTLDGSHFDADGDGEYTWKDYESRNW
jgi:hypothetical protein